MTVRVLWLFVPRVGLQCAIVVFPGHAHLFLSQFLKHFNDDGLMTAACIKSNFIHKLESMYEGKVLSIKTTDCILVKPL